MIYDEVIKTRSAPSSLMIPNARLEHFRRLQGCILVMGRHFYGQIERRKKYLK